MAYKITQWQYSNGTNYDEIPPEAGDRMLKIVGAECAQDSSLREVYTVSCMDLVNNAVFDLRFFITNINENAVRIEDRKQRGIVQSIGRALFGPDFLGLPNPVDIVGGVVRTELTVKESASGRVYARTYHFDPVPQDWAMLADIEQFYYNDDGTVYEPETEQPMVEVIDHTEDDA